MSNTTYTIECRHESGMSHWDREPDTEEYDTPHEALAIIDTLEAEDEEGCRLEYRVMRSDGTVAATVRK